MSEEKPAAKASGLDSETSLTNGQLWRRAATRILTLGLAVTSAGAAYVKAESAERQARTIEPEVESPADEVPLEARELFGAEKEQITESQNAAGEAEVNRMREAALQAQQRREAFMRAAWFQAVAENEAKEAEQTRQRTAEGSHEEGAPAVVPSERDQQFLACTKDIESDGNYQAVSPSGKYRGAYQFDQPTWDGTAQRAGRPDLAGVQPDHASPADQDAMAITLLHWRGSAPWLGRCDQYAP